MYCSIRASLLFLKKIVKIGGSKNLIIVLLSKWIYGPLFPFVGYVSRKPFMHITVHYIIHVLILNQNYNLNDQEE